MHAIDGLSRGCGDGISTLADIDIAESRDETRMGDAEAKKGWQWMSFGLRRESDTSMEPPLPRAPPAPRPRAATYM